jgi:hypothetical protein
MYICFFYYTAGPLKIVLKIHFFVVFRDMVYRFEGIES